MVEAHGRDIRKGYLEVMGDWLATTCSAAKAARNRAAASSFSRRMMS